jgi:hypothetical protein
VYTKSYSAKLSFINEMIRSYSLFFKGRNINTCSFARTKKGIIRLKLKLHSI